MWIRKTYYWDNDLLDCNENDPLLQDTQENDRWVDNDDRQEVNVIRRVYRQQSLNLDADYHQPSRTWKRSVGKCVADYGFIECIKSSLPIAKWLPRYSMRDYFLSDIIAGATVAVMHIPQGMAYAMLAEVPPIVGLYMAFFPVMMYIMFGTSPHISIGTFAVSCLMTGKTVTEFSYHPPNNVTLMAPNVTTQAPSLRQGDTLALDGEVHYDVFQVLCAVTLCVGLFQLLMWVLRLGCVATLLSEPLVSGFTTAAALIVMSSQLKDLFGVKLPKLPHNFSVIFTFYELARNLPNCNWAAVVVSAATCLLIALNNELLKPTLQPWIAKHCRVPIPIELIAIVVGTVASKAMHLQQNYGIKLVGFIPTGLPAPTLPEMSLLPLVMLDSFSICMVSYTVTMSMALIYASKEKYEIDANQELLALGTSNVWGSFFKCAPVCASLSRSSIQYMVGAKTNITTLVSATLILCVLLFIGPFFQDLPRCVLAAIIVVSLKTMLMQVRELKKFWKLSPLDACVWLATFLTTAFINIDIGLLTGLLFSIGSLFMRAQKPYTCLLGRVLNTDIYLDIKRYRAAEEIPGIKIFHYCGGLNFATKNLFRSKFFRKVGALRLEPSLHHEQHRKESLAVAESEYTWDPNVAAQVQCVIIDATALSYLDAPGIKMLITVQSEIQAMGITVLLAGANAPVCEMIKRYNDLIKEGLPMDGFFPTVHDAVVYFNILKTRHSKEKEAITMET